jgi:hypothetical protein
MLAARVEVKESEFFQMGMAEFLRWVTAYDEREQKRNHRWRVLVSYLHNTNVKREHRIAFEDVIHLPMYDGQKELRIISREEIEEIERKWPKQ